MERKEFVDKAFEEHGYGTDLEDKRMSIETAIDMIKIRISELEEFEPEATNSIQVLYNAQAEIYAWMEEILAQAIEEISAETGGR